MGGGCGVGWGGTRRRLFVKLLFISFTESSSSPIREPRTVALDSHITLVSFGEMIYCLILHRENPPGGPGGGGVGWGADAWRCLMSYQQGMCRRGLGWWCWWWWGDL